MEPATRLFVVVFGFVLWVFYSRDLNLSSNFDRFCSPGINEKAVHN